MKKTVLITGTSTGIGLATAKYFAAKGWNVVATMRKPETASPELKGPNLFVTQLDVLDEASIERAIKESIAKFGQIDALINNAGYGVMGVFEPTPINVIRRQFDTNVFGLMSVIRGILPHFRSRKSGVIVNLSSVGGRTTFPLFSFYHSTKFAVEGLTESLAYELGEFGIRVKLVEPGSVLTDFAGRSLDRVEAEALPEYNDYLLATTAKIEKAAKQGQRAHEVAAVIYRATTDGSKRLRYISGGAAKFLLFLKRLLPEALFRGFMRLTLNAL